MKKGNALIVFLLLVLVCAGFMACENNIIGKWWEEEQSPEIEYVPVIKFVPQYIYEIMIEKIPEIIFVNLPPEIIIEYVNLEPNPEQIIEYLKENPEKIIEYLAVDQIKKIISQQPPEIILQNISIIDIEYIIFAGNSSVFNGDPGPGGTTALTPQEKASNTANVMVIAQALVNPNYMLILHGNANPVSGTEQEKTQLIAISNERAESVAEALNAEYEKLPGGAAGVYPSERVTTSGYGGERNLTESSTSYAGLNRRVEMILFRVETIIP